MNRITRTLAIAIILSSLSFTACHKGGSEIKQITPEEAKKNAEIEKVAPHLAQTTRGAVERIGLAIDGATDSYHHQKWGDVAAYLNTARQETDKVLAETPDKKKAYMTRQLFEEMKEALDRTIQAADNRSQEVEPLLRELETRVGAMKVNLPQAPGQ
jgi:preprotein translocase subunit SecD